MAPNQNSKPSDIDASDLLLILIVSLLSMRILSGLLAGIFVEPDLEGEVAPEGELAFTIFLWVLNTLVVLAAIYYIALRKYGLTWADLGIGQFDSVYLRRGAFAGLLSLPVVIVVTKIYESFIGQPLENPQIDALMPLGMSWASLTILLILGSIVVPFAEEIAFRGLFYRWLKPRLGVPGSVVVSALVFALLHGIPQIIPAITALGIVLAIAAEVSDSIWPSIIAHGIFNAFMTITLYSAFQSGAALS